MPTASAVTAARDLQRSIRTLLFVDVVDYVRLIEAGEEETVRRWIDFVEEIETDLRQNETGRIVKRLGDGLMLEFGSAKQAVDAALKMRDRLAKLNQGLSADNRIELRIGLNTGEVLRSSDSDLYGQHVNIASRLAAISRPGEITASAEIREALASDIDAEFEDIGPVHLKNIASPVHAFRVATRSETPSVFPMVAHEDLLPTIAVMPIRMRHKSTDQEDWSDLITEDLIVALSRSDQMNVISRLSTASFTQEHLPLELIANALHAEFILSGNSIVSQGRIVLELELAEVRSGYVIWSDSINVETAALLRRNCFFSEVAAGVHAAILNVEMKRAQTHPVPTLEAYSLLSASIALMHRMSKRDFTLAGELLTSLIERIPHSPGPLAWKARWHVLRVAQGWSEDPLAEARPALDNIRRALDLDPTNSAALIAEGFVQNNLLHDLDEAEDLYDSALQHSPNDATGRALRGTLYAFRGEGARAVRDAERALHLAPLDPNRFFFQALAGGASLAAEDYPRALELCKSSLRLNRSHTSTLRIKAVTELRMGLGTEARRTTAKLMQLQPGFTVSSWKRNAPSAAFAVGHAFAESLRELGVPE